MQFATIDIRCKSEMDRRARPSFDERMRDVLETLRVRLREYRRAEASLEDWRTLQLEILGVAKTLRRRASEHEGAWIWATALWAKLGDAFWMERDLSRLPFMIEDVITELERLE